MKKQQLTLALVCFLYTLFASSLPANAEGKTRTYYIGVDEINWDYAPSGIDRDRKAFRSHGHDVDRTGHVTADMVQDNP